MRVTMLYFAAARERAGTGNETLQLSEGATAADALAAACAKHPALQAIVGKLRVAVDQEFVTETGVRLRDGAEVALIPPVSGGSGPHRVSAEALDPGAPLAAVHDRELGAIVTFVGTVRDANAGKRVTQLDYEAYPEMALRVFERIASIAQERWEARVSIHHRTGELHPGDVSVVIAAASRHRANAFEACRYAIEELKKDAPIWKREHYPDGTSWVGLGS
jgi:molybdopterin synthase catalytic subunit